MNKQVYSLSLLVSSAITLNLNICRKLFGSCFFAGTIKPCDYGQVYSMKECVGKFFDFDFCLDRTLLEST